MSNEQMTYNQVNVSAIIDGKKVNTEQKYARENPANIGEIVGYGPVNTREDARRAIDAAYAAFPKWAQTSLDERINRIKRAKEKLTEATSEFANILSREHGKPLYDSQSELIGATMLMELVCARVKEVLKDQIVEHEGGKTIIAHDPMGVVAAIFPWNFPISLSMVKFIPALLAGNTIVLKPSPYAPLAISKVIELIADEFPAGVINIVHGELEVGEELVTNPKVEKVAFTGGTKTGRQIMKSASATLKNITFELGGNDAAIVLPEFDVNDERAMRRFAVSNFLTTGQICMAVKRMYVHRSIYHQFVEKYIAAADKWIRVGDPFNPDVTVGPVNNKAQFQYVQSLIDDAKNNGAEVIKLGKILDPDIFAKGYFMQPTLVLNAAKNAPIVTEEQFGPTVPIVAYDDIEEAIALVNDSMYGLTSSVWGDKENAIKVARRIQAGTTMINTASVAGVDVRFPFGGVKQSGIGRVFGDEGILAFTEKHVINIPQQLDLPYIPE